MDDDDDDMDEDDVAAAAAAMAGFSMEIAPDIIWDNGYQLLWENSGIDISFTRSGCAACATSVSYSDTIQHHFRTGLRFNVN